MNQQLFRLRSAKRIILKFCREHWTEQHVAEVFAFADDNQMFALSICSCLLGVTGSNRLHQERNCRDFDDDTHHYTKAKELPGGPEAESAFCHLCIVDGVGNNRTFARLLRAEMRLRAWQKRQTSVSEPEVLYA